MELRHLRYFLAAADALHFTKAAEALNVSQPTLSLQIKELERELGTPLFDRVGRSVRLTAAGELFRRHAVAGPARSRAGSRGRRGPPGIAAGAAAGGGDSLLQRGPDPRAIASFRQRYPAVSALIERTSGRAIEQGLVAGSLDLGIAFAPPESPHIEAETLFDAEIVLITTPDHRLARRARVKLAELDRLPLVLPTREFATRRLLDDRMREARAAQPHRRDERHRFPARHRAPGDRFHRALAPRGGRWKRTLHRRHHRPQDDPHRRLALAPGPAPHRRRVRVHESRARGRGGAGLISGAVGRSAKKFAD